jgi:hypothetical protein
MELWPQVQIILKNLKGKPAYDKWKSYINNVAQQVGYKFLNFLGAEDSIESSAKEPIRAYLK